MDRSVIFEPNFDQKKSKKMNFISMPYCENDTSIHKLCPQSGLKHSVVRFQGIEMKFIFFQFCFFSKYFFNEISIHKFCPQSGLRHSVVHFQGIDVTFKIFWLGEGLKSDKLHGFWYFFSTNRVHGTCAAPTAT